MAPKRPPRRKNASVRPGYEPIIINALAASMTTSSEESDNEQVQDVRVGSPVQITITHAIQPPSFDGEGSLRSDHWLRDYELAADANNWSSDSDKLKHVPFFLKGQARKFYHGVYGTSPPADWAAFKKKFEEAFKEKKPVFCAMQRLQARKYTLSDSMRDYLFDMIELMNDVNPNMTVSEKCNYIILGLAPSAGKKFFGKPYTRLEDLQNDLILYEEREKFGDHRANEFVEAAAAEIATSRADRDAQRMTLPTERKHFPQRDYKNCPPPEQLFGDRKWDRPTERPPRFEEIPPPFGDTSRPQAFRGRQYNPPPPSPPRRYQDQRPMNPSQTCDPQNVRRCFECNRDGHFAAQCFRRQFCQNCGRQGHPTERCFQPRRESRVQFQEDAPRTPGNYRRPFVHRDRRDGRPNFNNNQFSNRRQ